MRDRSTFPAQTRHRRGLSLLEVLISVFILTLTLWSAQYLYIGLLRGTTQSENKQLALAAGETVYKVAQNRVRELWRNDLEEIPDQYDYFQNLAYRVEVGPRLDNPTYELGDPVNQAKLQLRPLVVRIEYEERGVKKELRLRGAVSK